MKRGRSFDEIELGETLDVEFDIDDARVQKFADATGDHNPIHLDDAYAEASPFGRRVAHGVLLTGIVSGILGIRLPGLGTVARETYSKYMKPVYIGDTVHVAAEVTEKVEKTSTIKITFKVTNQDGKMVARGYAVVIPPPVG